MAIMDVNFYSNALVRHVTFKAILPIENQVNIKPFKTLYLLHGIMGNYNDWVSLTRVVEYALEHKIAVIMPSGDNAFYVDQPASHNLYGEFIGRELVEETRKLFRLSDKREDTFIAGLSMGGYGAIRNGLKYSQTFGKLAGLSSALIIDQVINSTEEAGWHFGKRSYYEAVFGDLNHLVGSDMDPEALVRKLKESNSDIPKIYFACGTEDFLIHNNRKFRDFLNSENIQFTYEEGPGIHNWKFWDTYIEKVINWLIQE